MDVVQAVADLTQNSGRCLSSSTPTAEFRVHWNANLEVAAIEHHEDTNIVPMAILRARKEIEKDTKILTRYWHKEKDAWQNKFECQCCACTNRTGTTITTPIETAE